MLTSSQWNSTLSNTNNLIVPPLKKSLSWELVHNSTKWFALNWNHTYILWLHKILKAENLAFFKHQRWTIKSVELRFTNLSFHIMTFWSWIVLNLPYFKLQYTIKYIDHETWLDQFQVRPFAPPSPLNLPYQVIHWTGYIWRTHISIFSPLY